MRTPPPGSAKGLWVSYNLLVAGSFHQKLQMMVQVISFLPHLIALLTFEATFFKHHYFPWKQIHHKPFTIYLKFRTLLD